ncbi:hypothetical protein LF935_06410, partial [Pectobacterium carotovorum]|uniref:hypothetical protein n=2 Tax=Pectobacterium carotovorum TaxID=554 RepID=UPI001CF3A98E
PTELQRNRLSAMDNSGSVSGCQRLLSLGTFDCRTNNQHIEIIAQVEHWKAMKYVDSRAGLHPKIAGVALRWCRLVLA